MLRVYGDVRSGNCYKVKLALHQLGKAYEWSDVDVVKGETRTPDFLALNPRGQIPLLITEDGTALPESNAILYYLCADSSLWPGDLMARTQVLRWMFFEQYTHEPAIAVARFIVAYLGRPAEREAALQQKIADGHKALALMETHLAQNDFFAGAYSIADIALYAYTHVAEQGLVALETYPKSSRLAFACRCTARPCSHGRLSQAGADLAPMVGLEHPILTPRLRLEPVTAALAEAARAGRAAFADVIGAEAPDEWCASNLQLVARSVSDLWGAAPTRVIAIHHEDWEVVGDVRFEPLLSAEGAPTGDFEIGYSIAAQRRRQGYATEAAGAVIDWLFDEYGAQTIVAGCDSRNLASVRTLRKLGFWLDSTPGRTFWWLITPKLRSATRA